MYVSHWCMCCLWVFVVVCLNGRIVVIFGNVRRYCVRSVWYCVVLYEIVWCIVLLCDVLYEIVWNSVMYCDVLWCIVILCDVLWYYVMYCDIVWNSVMYCGIVWCIVVLCGIVWNSVMYCGIVYLFRYFLDWCGRVVIVIPYTIPHVRNIWCMLDNT